MPWILSLALFLIALDFSSKYWVQAHLPLMSLSPPYYPFGGIGIFHDFLGIDFSLVHATNKGAAWSLFSDYTALLLALRLGLLIALLIIFFREKNNWLKFPLALIIVGAFGNILDIFLYGHVIDMFYFILFGYSYPVFNVADSAICVGVFLYILLSWNSSHDPKTAL